MSTTAVADHVSIVDEPVVINYEPPTHESWFSRHRSTREGIAFAVAFFAVSRALTAFCVYAGTSLVPGRNMRESFLAWDSGWYYGLVLHGYPHVAYDPNTPGSAANTIAFFPLYPLMVRFLHNVSPLTVLQSGITVSLVGGALASAFIWLLARRLTNEKTASRAIVLFCLFPGSVSVLLMMSEGVMLALSAASLYFLLKRQWVLAGILAACATATRPTAIVLVACALWASAMAIRETRDWKSLAAPLLAPCGILAYFVFLRHHTGNFFAWNLVEEKGWAYGDLGHFYGFKSFHVFFQNPLVDLNASATAIGIMLAGTGLVLMALWRPPFAITVFVLGILVLATFSGGWGSKIRYVYSAFPIAIAAAHWAKTDLRFLSLASTAGVSLAVYTILVTQTTHSIL